MTSAVATATPVAPGFTAERRFYTGMALAMLAVVFVGFSRSFFLKPLFPGHPAPSEKVFYVHGVIFTAWMLFLIVQSVLIGARRTPVHRRLGWLGVALAVAMVAIGWYGAAVSAARPAGVIGVTQPGLEFFAFPFFDMVLFGAFVALAIAARTRPQSHKRWMVLATTNLLTAAVGRFPWLPSTLHPMVFFGLTDVFVVALALWDLKSRRRLHPVTLWGGLLMIAMQPLRVPLAKTAGWLAFATWAVDLVR